MANEMNEETRKQIMEFQQIQQQLQMLSYQMQSLKGQEMEVTKALEEVEKGGEKFYRYVGSIIVPKTKEELEKELKKEKEEVETRIKMFETQIEKLKKKNDEVRQTLEKALPKPNNGEGAQING